MIYDRGLAQRVRELLAEEQGFAEKKMFGGVCFLLHGNMACGIFNDDLIIRVGVTDYEAALTQPHTRRFDISGRAMKGWVMVAANGHEADDDLSG